MLTYLNNDFNGCLIPDEKAYPTMDAAPNFRQSAGWGCCSLATARGRHRRPGIPIPTIAMDLLRRSGPTCRPGLRPALPAGCKSCVSSVLNTNVENIATRQLFRSRQPSQGSAIMRTSPPVLRVRSFFLYSPHPLVTARNPQMPMIIKRLGL